MACDFVIRDDGDIDKRKSSAVKFTGQLWVSKLIQPQGGIGIWAALTGVQMIVVLLTTASANLVKQLQVIVMRWLSLNVAKAGSKRCIWIARSSRKKQKAR